MIEEFGIPRTKPEKISHLLHLYIDGGIDRRTMFRRLVRLTGGATAAMATLESEGLAQESRPACPDNIKVSETDPAVTWSDVTYPGEAGSCMGLLARPSGQTDPQPAVIVIHENRGLTEHIRDVTRRVAKAGFVALGVDLLARQGGSGAFPNDTARGQAYGRTVANERYNDIYSAIEYLHRQDFVIRDRIGAIGFCVGGGDIYYGIFNNMPLQAAVPFYGTPPNPIPDNAVTTPVLAIFSETDRNQAARIPALATALVNARVTFEIHLYKGTGHGFHNDTGAIYNPAAACLAWDKSIRFFNTILRAPA